LPSWVKRSADNRSEIRLTAEQYQALGQALEAGAANGENSTAIVAIRLLALTGCRRGETVCTRYSSRAVPLTGGTSTLIGPRG
jgi:hypothetical protein